MEGCRRQVGELRCQELKWQRQVDTIGEAVAALSGQVPSGCELHLVNECVSTSVSLDELTVIGGHFSFRCMLILGLSMNFLMMHCMLNVAGPDDDDGQQYVFGQTPRPVASGYLQTTV